MFLYPESSEKNGGNVERSRRLKSQQIGGEGHSFSRHGTPPFKKEPYLADLVRLRICQLKGASFQVGYHEDALALQGEDPFRLAQVQIWRGSSLFTPRECFAFAFSEIIVVYPESNQEQTLMAAQLYFSKSELVDLVVIILAVLDSL